MVITVNPKDTINPNNLNTSLKTLYPRYIPTTVRKVAPKAQINPATAANPKNQNKNFMMIPELRELCFNIFSSFRIYMTFFFMRHPSHRSLMFQDNQRCRR